MLPFILVLMTGVLMIEGQIAEALLSALAAASSGVALQRGFIAGKLVQEAFNHLKPSPVWRRIGFNGPNQIRLKDPVLLEAIVFVHVLATPPWFFVSTKESFFYPLLCALAFVAGGTAWMNDVRGRKVQLSGVEATSGDS